MMRLVEGFWLWKENRKRERERARHRGERERETERGERGSGRREREITGVGGERSPEWREKVEREREFFKFFIFK